MKRLLICVAVIFTSLAIFAQDSTRIIINPTNQNDQDLKNRMFQYRQFVPGRAIYNNGTETPSNLNYSYLTNNIHFISPKGDTLELSQGENFSAIVIASDTFRYYKKAFLQQITHNPNFNLLLKRSLRYSGLEKKGAYGTYSSTAASTSISNIHPNEGMGYTKLSPDENAVYVFQDDYFFAGKFGQVYPANKKGLHDFFGKNEKQLKDFMESNQINLSKKEDLQKVLDFALTTLK